MKNILFILCNFWVGLTFAQSIQLSEQKNDFPLVTASETTAIFIDGSDAEVVGIASKALAKDIELITGKKPAVNQQNKKGERTSLIIGTLGQSKWIDRMVASGKIDVTDIKGNWENFKLITVDKPIRGVKKALVIVGSDRRGTAFGVFHLSKILGVSPLVWWADVLPEKRNELYLTAGSYTSETPSVKFRGIFLNDEDWGLQPWAAKNMDTDVKDIGPKTYARIFELLLRLKGNYIWPAMHPSTRAFYYYKENPVVADKYAIVVGSSHCEPMLRNNVFEWKKNYENEYGNKPKEWRYDLNKEQIHEYWEDRAKESKGFESVYTIGMRGIHDGSMPGPKNRDKKIKLLEKVIQDQRSIFLDQFKEEVGKISQIFCPYKEVLGLYQSGLDLPEDITIVWADDNHGYIRQLSTPEERARSGKSGVYYHLSYWGRPRDYLWLSSISPSLISYEMTKAYTYGADRLWVINVGDIKPAELEMEFALDLAWDVDKWSPKRAHQYTLEWAKRTFGAQYAEQISGIKRDYYRLAQAGKPEHLGDLEFTKEEAKERLVGYQELSARVDTLKNNIPERLQDAYFQLIYYPVHGARLMNEKIFYARKSLDLAAKGDDTAIEYSQKAETAFEEIKRLTRVYNEEIAGGKWNGIMDWKPRDLGVFKMPKVASEGDIKKTVEGGEVKRSPKTIVVNVNNPVAQSDQLEIIKELGPAEAAITRTDLLGESYKEEELDKAPFATYEVNLDPGTYQLEVRCLPTHKINKNFNLTYAVAVNGNKTELKDVHSRSQTREWSANVLRGYSSEKSSFTITKVGKQQIKLHLLDPGLVIGKLIISKQGI
ncbi:glycosyl hydrolase 115 family protein [Galbibacter sp. EGI 63066]|uniref:glycosyl hydrolase 115 family protein n=1 Tax=Galbibacter sp. EGI 63066 TaxID=2993559 RepID=UPI002248A939|nr:glycosyl hydrolase 115 family protein [Galbibacter sp. EGI 63066]MCX2679825.1 glycosyl hydrolase 115 family protein [Galbibacter sp. EGI 63066]